MIKVKYSHTEELRPATLVEQEIRKCEACGGKASHILMVITKYKLTRNGEELSKTRSENFIACCEVCKETK